MTSRPPSALEYLEQKKIRELLERILVSVVEARPENPQLYIVEMLRKGRQGAEAWPPDMTRAASHEPIPPHENRRSAVVPYPQLTSSPSRRNAFSSKMTSATDVHIVVYPKDEATTQTLIDIVKRVGLFSFLGDEQRATLVGVMFPKDFHDGDVIMHQGDQADNFYILTDGRCRVLKKAGGTESQVAVLNPGQYFGEVALISGSGRTATIIALGEVKTWALDQMTYLGLLKEGHTQKRRQYHSLLRNVPFLSALSDHEIELVTDALMPLNPKEAEVVIKQGERGDEFYIILDGECTVSREDPSSHAIFQLGKLKAGGYFGELALMTEAPRAATVTAGPGCKLVKLDRSSFHRLLGPCNRFFTENAKLYETRTD
jgi:cAMP-dependent protein kinase regulator